jgi:aspartate aminotransferase
MDMIAGQIKDYISNASWIRRMFEAGIEMKKQHGEANVYDFSLGNPDLPPPPAVSQALHRLADRIDRPLSLGYMPNPGYPSVRAKLAEHLAREQECAVKPDHVVVTCGAAGAINAFFRAVLESGDEVVCPTPYFVEYGFYAGNFGGILKPVPSVSGTFDLDVGAIERALSPRTRAVLMNSPNNPTGVVYGRKSLELLSAILSRHTAKTGRPVYLVSDEPYRFLAYDGVTVPPVLPLYPYTVAVSSFSKSLSLAGERVGYLVASPLMPGVQELIGGVVLTNRILGYVNAPAIGQRLVEETLGHQVDAGVYRDRRDAMAAVLTSAGIEFTMPKGAFYFFPKVPGRVDDVAFCGLLQQQRVLAVPGRGFGLPGYFRLTFCVDKAIVERSAESFKRATANALA